MKAIISGGGSGGHIFPAIAIANAIKKRWNDADILFIGAEGRMEMEKVPLAGYPIKGLPIAGLQRKITAENIRKNLALPYKVLRSRAMVRKILADFKPDVVIGVGGFASEPTLRTAASMGFPTLIQEQNSYAGLTNKSLSKKARTICVAYDGMDRFFPSEKIVFTGNPVRADIENMNATKHEGCSHFDLDPTKQIVLSIGGSLGAESINKMLMGKTNFFKDNDIQLLWQTGKWMYQEALEQVRAAGLEPWIKIHEFISRMDLAYSAADVVISRAGAIAISELCLVGKPTILIPSPNVAEDHQTKNAMALSEKGAAVVIADIECRKQGIKALKELLETPTRREEMSKAILQLGRRNAADRIVDEIEKLIKHE